LFSEAGDLVTSGPLSLCRSRTSTRRLWRAIRGRAFGLSTRRTFDSSSDFVRSAVVWRYLDVSLVLRRAEV
jgi:hypothetical protein